MWTILKLNKKKQISYHHLIMGKPSYDILIDDKSWGFNENWNKYIKKKFLKKTEN